MMVEEQQREVGRREGCGDKARGIRARGGMEKKRKRGKRRTRHRGSRNYDGTMRRSYVLFIYIIRPDCSKWIRSTYYFMPRSINTDIIPKRNSLVKCIFKWQKNRTMKTIIYYQK